MINIPYSYRLGALAFLAIAMVLYERLFRRSSHEREWEYGFLFFAGILGAFYGAVNDAVTSELSPVYFTVGKGLAGTGTIKYQAMMLGAQAGFSAAVVTCAIWQFLLRRISARQRCALIFKHLWIPFSLAPLLGLVFPLFSNNSDPLLFANQLRGIILAEDLPGFLAVWWVHLGTYTGLIAGVAIGIHRTRRCSRRHSSQS
ncbi:MAG: hypothetical protein C0404_09605 [Verrucomicrobia bacterium]|nr:hypothetical protein [Verrucomicrobiota bacterium]